ncbi:MAG: hypothetical protein MJY62_01225 [Bacteroidales bacterium]|nr:hypothetical protein [Bacteroidales bacterium]
MSNRKFPKWIKAILLSFAGIVVLAIVAVSIILSQKNATALVNKYSDEFLDASLEFSNVDVSILRKFPSISITLSDASLTYPSSRFAKFDSMYSGQRMMRMGKGEEVDTLASFKKLTVATNIVRILSGQLDVRNLELDGPRIFARQYNDTTANWNIFPESDGEDAVEEEDTLKKESFFDRINIRRVALTDKPFISFCSPEKEIYACFGLKDMTLGANVKSSDILSNEIDLGMEKLFISGRYRTDTLLYAIDQVNLKAHKRRVRFDLRSNLYAAVSDGIGRHSIPFEIKLAGGFPKDTVPCVAVKNLDLKVMGLEARCKGFARAEAPERYYVKASAEIKNYKVGDFMDEYLSLFVPSLKDFSTNALLSVSASADGIWCPSAGEIPSIDATVDIPASQITRKSIDQSLGLELHATAETTPQGAVNATVDTVAVTAEGIDIGLNAFAHDLLGADPLLGASLNVFADLSHASNFLPDEIPYIGSGIIKASAGGQLHKSQLSLAEIANAPAKVNINSDALHVESTEDTTIGDIKGLDITLAAQDNKFDRNFDADKRMLSLTCKADSISASLPSMEASVGKLFIGTQNDPSLIARSVTGNGAGASPSEEKKITVAPLCGIIKVGNLKYKDSDGMAVYIKDNTETYRITAHRRSPEIPVLSVSSKNGRVIFRSGDNRAFGKDINLRADAVMHPLKKRTDSTAVRRPRMAFTGAELPDWLQEKEFRESDIDIHLSGTAAKIFQMWELGCDLSVGRLSVATPLFPLRTGISDFKGHVSNDEIRLDNLSVKSGRSNLKVKGNVRGLRRALISKGMLRADIDIQSDSINANELLAAMAKGQQYRQKADSSKTAVGGGLDDITDENYENEVVCDTLGAADPKDMNALLVVPANINAAVGIHARNIRWQNMLLNRLESGINVGERCLQISEFKAWSDMGNFDFSAFYSTRTKKDIKCGFSLELSDVTAEKVIDIFPQIDTLVPILSSFKGKLTCDVAATSDLDTAMNIVGPSMEGVFRITGKKLSLVQDKDIRKITTLLMFHDKKVASIDTLCLDGVLSHGKLEIFPCVLDVDRYRLAMSGVQNMDASFRYHVSVLKAPLWIKLGVDLYGQNFDDMNFKLGKAKYQNGNIPVFTEVVDTVQVNLRTSISNIFKKGVDKAIRENNVSELFESTKKKANYKNAADEPLDSLSAKDVRRMNNLRKMMDSGEIDIDTRESISAASLDSLDVREVTPAQ